MKLELVTGRQFTVVCKGCGARRIAGDEIELDSRGLEWSADKVYADLDGQPFKAYYCEVCANTLTVKEARQ